MSPISKWNLPTMLNTFTIPFCAIRFECNIPCMWHNLKEFCINPWLITYWVAFDSRLYKMFDILVLFSNLVLVWTFWNSITSAQYFYIYGSDVNLILTDRLSVSSCARVCLFMSNNMQHWFVGIWSCWMCSGLTTDH